MRPSSLPLTGREIYQGCRTPSINSRFSGSPSSPDLGPSSSAREFYQGFESTSAWSEYSSQNSTGTEDEGPRFYKSADIKREFYQGFESTSEGSEYSSPNSTDTEDEGPRFYKSADIKRITNHFRRPIASGKTFRNVYIGKLDDGSRVAVKVLPSELWQSSHHFNQFKLLVEKFALLKHKNLLRINGYCFEERNSALIMEHMPGGSLKSFMDNSVGSSWKHIKPLTWEQRLQIILDVAQGLEYLHQSCTPPVTHGKVTMTNILLDKNLNAKLAEPGYTIRSHFDEHRDIYDFGAVLWLLITGLTPSVLKTSYLTDHEISGRTWGLLSLDRYPSCRFHSKVPNILISKANNFCNLQRSHAGWKGRGYGPSIFNSPEVCVCPVIMIAAACTFTYTTNMPSMKLIVNNLRLCLNMARGINVHARQ